MTRVGSVLLRWGREAIEVALPAEVEVIEPTSTATTSPERPLAQALAEPLDSPPLSELVRRSGANSAVVIVPDQTRRAHVELVLPRLLTELERGGLSPSQLTVVVALGLHREMSDSELVNRAVLNTGLRITLSEIDAHYFAGFSGGRKAILPGTCARESIIANHCLVFDETGKRDPTVELGRLAGNPLVEELAEAQRMVGVDFAVNIVNDSNGSPQAVIGGAVLRDRCGTLRTLWNITERLTPLASVSEPTLSSPPPVVIPGMLTCVRPIRHWTTPADCFVPEGGCSSSPPVPKEPDHWEAGSAGEARWQSSGSSTKNTP